MDRCPGPPVRGPPEAPAAPLGQDRLAPASSAGLGGAPDVI